MIILNNPFVNYLDVKFEKPLTGKISLKLTDLTGQLMATEKVSVSAQTLIRFNLNNKVIKSGMYIFSAEINGEKYTASVIKQ